MQRTNEREILTVAEMGEADRRVEAAGTPALSLMERAGEAVAAAVAERFAEGPVLVLCGPGNNGGDGFIAARRLAQAGRAVTVAAAVELDKLKGPAAEAARTWEGPVRRLSEIEPKGAAAVIDALFGAGLRRPLSGPPLSALKAVQAAGPPVVAVDLPSGLDGDTAKPLGFVLGAALTVTFHRKKPAHVLDPGKGCCGEVRVADIGLDDPVPALRSLHENGPGLWLHAFPGRAPAPTRPSGGAWWWSAVTPGTPARRGWRQGAVCGSARGW